MVSRRDRALRRLFRPLERLGVHATPVHYYEPVPDTRTLADSLWDRASELPGIDWRGAEQLALLDQLARRYRDEFASFAAHPTSDPHEYYLLNPQFSKVDAEALYGMIRRHRPGRVIEIGSGHSTMLAARAIRDEQAGDPSYACRFTAIEPYPDDRLRAGVPGLTELIERPVQDVPLEVFDELDDGDILFIDSSHVLKIGSDVQREYLDIVPRVRRGVIVHVHDVFLPYEYPRHLVVEWQQFWNEQYLVQAFLSFNDAFEVVWSSAWLLAAHAELLQQALPSLATPGWSTGLPPSSLWIRRVR